MWNKEPVKIKTFTWNTFSAWRIYKAIQRKIRHCLLCCRHRNPKPRTLSSAVSLLLIIAESVIKEFQAKRVCKIANDARSWANSQPRNPYPWNLLQYCPLTSMSWKLPLSPPKILYAFLASPSPKQPLSFHYPANTTSPTSISR